MSMNPLQMQIVNHFRPKIEEHTTTLNKCKADIMKSQGDIPSLVQKIHENELTKNVF